MKIDTEKLAQKMEQLDNCLSDYYPEVEVMFDKFNEISLTAEKIMNEVLEEDKSHIMRILYKEEIDNLKDFMESAGNYLLNVKGIAEDLSFDVEDNWKELMNEEY